MASKRAAARWHVLFIGEQKKKMLVLSVLSQLSVKVKNVTSGELVSPIVIDHFRVESIVV